MKIVIINLIFVFSWMNINCQTVQVFEYTYDNLERQTQYLSAGDTILYQYDEVGNLISREVKAYCSKSVLVPEDNVYGSARRTIECLETGDTVLFHPILLDETIFIDQELILDKDLVFYQDGSNEMNFVSTFDGTLFRIGQNTTIELVNTILIGTNNPLSKALFNQGIAIFDGVILQCGVGVELENQGELIIKGEPIIKD